MRRELKKKRTRKLGRRKLRRNRTFWERVTTCRYERILKIAGRFTNINEAEDLAQSVIFRLLKYCPKPIRIINLDAYIFASTKNAWLDSQRQKKEINFSELKKRDLPKIAVLDPNLTNFLETCDIKALVKKSEPNNTKLLQTKIWIQAGFTLPDIAIMLNEPVRRTRYRWYRYRNAQQKALRLIAKNIASSKGR